TRRARKPFSCCDKPRCPPGGIASSSRCGSEDFPPTRHPGRSRFGKNMTKRNGDDLYDPRNGDPAIRTQRLDLGRKPFEPARTNYFSVYLVEVGSGTFWADASHFEFGPGFLLFFVPYQHVRFEPHDPVHAEVIQFHANFLCVETFHAEVGCSGVLFNDPYGIPVVKLEEQAKQEVVGLIDRI